MRVRFKCHGLRAWTVLAFAAVLVQVTSCQYYTAEHQRRSLIHLGNRLQHECDRSLIMQDFVTIEGNVKMTTAPEPGTARRQTICKTPLVPFGKLTQDRRGIHFWYLRLKITQLLSGQKLSIVNTDSSSVGSQVESDQKFDLTEKSHTYPVILYMKYRYVRFYWSDSRPSGQENHINITVSTYAKFNDTVNATMQQELCNLYANTWCSRPSVSACIGPNSCSMQDDCFDLFSEPSRCSDFLWINGNLTITGSSLRATSWILRNLPWFALGTVPLVLVVALAKICSQKRDLDIDDDYEYKLSCSDYHDSGACRNGNALHGCPSREERAGDNEDGFGEGDGDDESSASSDSEAGNRARDRDGTYYSYPSAVATDPPAEKSEAADAHEAEAGSSSPEESSPPPPPPRLSQSQPKKTSEVVTNSNNRVLHRLTEVSLEDDDEDGAETGGKAAARVDEEEEEEEEFVNVEYLRQHPTMPSSAEADRTVSGEYTQAEPSGSPQRDSYTRLLSQPSPDTIKELLKPSSQAPPPSYKEALSAEAEGGGRLVYAQLVLPPPSRAQPAAAAVPAESAPSESLELQAVKAPKPARGTYDSNYIVV